MNKSHATTHDRDNSASKNKTTNKKVILSVYRQTGRYAYTRYVVNRDYMVLDFLIVKGRTVAYKCIHFI